MAQEFSQFFKRVDSLIVRDILSALRSRSGVSILQSAGKGILESPTTDVGLLFGEQGRNQLFDLLVASRSLVV